MKSKYVQQQMGDWKKAELRELFPTVEMMVESAFTLIGFQNII